MNLLTYCIFFASGLRQKNDSTFVPIHATCVYKIMRFLHHVLDEILLDIDSEYNGRLALRTVEKVTVYEDKFAVEFKTGVTVDVN